MSTSLWALLSIFLSVSSFAESITVAVAANFTAPMKVIASQFEQTSGHTVNLVFGSTGMLATQIINGAPFSILFAADQATPAALLQQGLAVTDSQLTYAVGILVLWSAKKQLVDAQGDILRNGNFNKLALANPQLAPYGAAAMEVLEAMGIRAKIQNKLVLGDNITQAYQFIATGNADLGFVSLSQIIGQEITSGSIWYIPKAMYAPIRQDAILLRKGENNRAAVQLMAMMRTEKIRAMIATFGYENPVAPHLK